MPSISADTLQHRLVVRRLKKLTLLGSLARDQVQLYVLYLALRAKQSMNELQGLLWRKLLKHGPKLILEKCLHIKSVIDKCKEKVDQLDDNLDCILGLCTQTAALNDSLKKHEARR